MFDRSTERGVGEIVAGRYRLEERLGRGGFGEVWRATQLDLGRQVALKLLHHERASSATDLRRFQREALLAQQLEHPNTVRLNDFGQTREGLPYISYELLRGRTLKSLLDEVGPLPGTRAVRIASQVLKSLMEAHAIGIVHRDIKPENIFLVDFEGEADFVKLLDLGIAKPVGTDQRELALTGVDEIIGTAFYMAPEQVCGEGVGPATDLYALGLVLGEMLTGRVVVHGKSPIQVLATHLDDAPLPLPDEVTRSPLAAVVERAVQKDPAARYPVAGQMLADLELAASGLDSRELPSWPAPAEERPMELAETLAAPREPTSAPPAREASPPRRFMVTALALAATLVALAAILSTSATLLRSRPWAAAAPESSGTSAIATGPLAQPSAVEGGEQRSSAPERGAPPTLEPPPPLELPTLTVDQLRAQLTELGWAVAAERPLVEQVAAERQVKGLGSPSQEAHMFLLLGESRRAQVVYHRYADAEAASRNRPMLTSPWMDVVTSGPIVLVVSILDSEHTFHLDEATALRTQLVREPLLGPGRRHRAGSSAAAAADGSPEFTQTVRTR